MREREREREREEKIVLSDYQLLFDLFVCAYYIYIWVKRKKEIKKIKRDRKREKARARKNDKLDKEEDTYICIYKRETERLRN